MGRERARRGERCAGCSRCASTSSSRRQPRRGDRTLALTAGASAHRASRVASRARSGAARKACRAGGRARVGLAVAGSGGSARRCASVAMPPDTVTRIDLHDAHGRVGLRRVGGAWTFSPPAPPYPADTRAVDEWLARLGAIKAATRLGRRQRAPPARRGALSPADRRFIPGRRLCAARARSAALPRARRVVVRPLRRAPAAAQRAACG